MDPRTSPLSQQMLMLSYVVYAGTKLTGDSLDARLGALFTEVAARSPLLAGQWTGVWGPATFVAPGETTAANVVFVAQSVQTPNTYALVVRGTNSAAPYDLLEDFGVHSAVAWPFGQPAPLQPQIARGYGLAMQAIAAMEPTAGAAAAGQTLLQWLSALTASGAAIHLLCTGQSLGGGLAPTVALWLQNVQGADWDPQKKATVSAISFAGPTAGDADFAAWSEACLGERLIRVVNSLDVAPRTWNAAQMTSIPDLYGTIAGYKVAALLVAAQLRLSAGVSYTQPFADLPPLEGTQNPNQTYWFTQAAWQHVYGYLQILGLEHELPLVAWIFGPGATAEPSAAV